MSSKDKSRQFTFLIYPESAPEGWQKMLESMDVPVAISPLHDKDVDKKMTEALGGEIQYKKEHYHCIIIFPHPLTQDAVRKKIQRAFGSQSEDKEVAEKAKKAIAIVQIIATSVENTYLYLTHESKDAKEKGKHVYSKEKIMLLNHFDVSRYSVYDEVLKDEMFETICDLIEEHLIPNLFQLRKFLRENGSEYDLDVKKLNKIIQSKTGLLRLHFDGAYQELKNQEEKSKQKGRKTRLNAEDLHFLEELDRKVEECFPEKK